MARHAWTTWANLLTLLRLALVPAHTLAILHLDWRVAAFVFALAVVTDVLDGKLARRMNQASPLGGLLDHSVDAAFVTASAWALAEIGLINPWLAWLIPAAFIQYTLDSRALQGHALRTSVLGRVNGIAYFAVTGTAIGGELLGWPPLALLVTWSAWALVVSSVASMLDRAMTLWRVRTQS